MNKPDNTNARESRRRFLKAGINGAASIATLGAVAASGIASASQQDSRQQDEEIKWVGAGYLMARPVKNSEVS
jgi:hypothetical protein